MQKQSTAIRDKRIPFAMSYSCRRHSYVGSEGETEKTKCFKVSWQWDGNQYVRRDSVNAMKWEKKIQPKNLKKNERNHMKPLCQRMEKWKRRSFGRYHHSWYDETLLSTTERNNFLPISCTRSRSLLTQRRNIFFFPNAVVSLINNNNNRLFSIHL